MLFSLTKPSDAQINAFIAAQKTLPFNYPNPGCTHQEQQPARFNADHYQVKLGHGAAVFQKAKNAIEHWQQFTMPMMQLCWPNAPITMDTTVAIVAKTGFLWGLNACRVVYIMDEPRRYGFAYGTLPGHVARGEERFLLEWLDNDEVWYEIIAYSQPRHPLVWLGYPVMRFMQRTFRIHSGQAMIEAVR